MNTIESTIASFLKIDLADIRSKSKKKELVEARRIIWYFLNNDGETFNDIAPRYGITGQGVRKGVNKAKNQALFVSLYRNKLATIQAVIVAKEI